MLFPVRCCTCNKLIGHLWETFKERRDVNHEDPEAIFENLNIKRYCCRTKFLSFVDLIDKVLEYCTPNDTSTMNEITRCYKTD